MTKSVGVATIIGILITGLGVVVPIVWDVYKGRAELELQHIATATLVSAEARPDQITVLYENKAIPSLSKIALALVNTGRTPIRQQDIVSYPAVSVKDEIIDVTIDRVAPPELTNQSLI